MPQEQGAEATWAWYALQTPDCSPLDRSAYPAAQLAERTIPWPDWACRAPDGGVHIDARRSRIDVHIAKTPKPRLQLGWTCEFGAILVRRDWLALIEDLLVDSSISVGEVSVSGRRLDSWATLHGSNAPPLLSTEGWSKTCPTCGSIYSTLHGREFFAARAALSKPVIVNWTGIFIRSDIFEARRLPVPRGAFKPDWVSLEELH